MKINVGTSAKVKLDVAAEELVIDEEADKAEVTVKKPLDKIVNQGKGTKLEVNNDIQNIVSTGSNLSMKIAAGSKVSSIETTGDTSSITVALGSRIDNIITKGNGATIGGDGVIGTVKVEGNNTEISNRSASIIVAENITGTKANGIEVNAGTNIIGSSGGSGSGYSDYPSYEEPREEEPREEEPGEEEPGEEDDTDKETPPATGAVITINNPGEIWAGKTVQFTASLEDVTWEVYNYMDDTEGYASINPTTGVLNPKKPGIVRVVAIVFYYNICNFT